MSEKEKSNTFETWQEVINDFLQRKIEAEEEKYLKEVIKVVAKQYGDQKFYNNHEIEKFFDPKKNKKTDSQSAIEFQRFKFNHLFDFDEKPENLNQVMLTENYLQRCNELADKYEPHTWLTKASNDAANVSFATHVSKLTHSKINSPSFYDQVLAQKRGILATTDLKKIIVDGAVSGNQFAPVFQFLQLEFKGNKLVSALEDESNTILQGFAETPEELKSWNLGFKQALVNRNVSTHFLAKQVYFPVTQKSPLLVESYHLLCNVKSSSLAHAIFEKLRDTDQKKIKKSLEKNRYNILPRISFVGKASLKVTASNPSNASQLNGKRGGKLALFCSQPPLWEGQLKPPIHQSSFLYTGLNYRKIKEPLDFLRDFLIRFEKIDLSIKSPKKKRWIDGWVHNIMDEIFIYVACIQNLPPGWSNTKNIKLKQEHQYLLDPHRDDDDFQKVRQSTDWQTVVCSDFANWLNGRLKGKDKKFTPQREHTMMWRKLMEKELREHTQLIEVDRKFQNGRQ